jgi:hypothetical protein
MPKTPANVGAMRWPGAGSAYLTAGEMQLKSHRCAETIPPVGSVTGSTLCMMRVPAGRVGAHGREHPRTDRRSRRPTVATIVTWDGM